MRSTSPACHSVDNGKPYTPGDHTPGRTSPRSSAPGNEYTTPAVCVSACLPPPVAIVLLARTIHVEAHLDLWLTRNRDIASTRRNNLGLATWRRPQRLAQINLDHQDRAIHTHRYIL